MRVIGKVRHARDIQRADFEFLQGAHAAHAEGDDPVADDAAFPRRPRRHQPGSTIRTSSSSTPTWRRPMATSCARWRGRAARYVQMDDTNLAYLCDPKMREAARARGDDPNELPHRYATFINRVVAQKPAGMTLAVHLCRGNFKSTHAAEGGYEPVAEALLSEMNVDAYFLEYDDERSGDFRPLRFLPKGKIVVLGLITTKLGALEIEGRNQAAHRRGGEIRAARSTGAVAAVRILEQLPRQRHPDGPADREVAAGGGIAARLGAERMVSGGIEMAQPSLTCGRNSCPTATRPCPSPTCSTTWCCPRTSRRPARSTATCSACAPGRGRRSISRGCGSTSVTSRASTSPDARATTTRRARRSTPPTRSNTAAAASTTSRSPPRTTTSSTRASTATA